MSFFRKHRFKTEKRDLGILLPEVAIQISKNKRPTTSSFPFSCTNKSVFSGQVSLLPLPLFQWLLPLHVQTFLCSFIFLILSKSNSESLSFSLEYFREILYSLSSLPFPKYMHLARRSKIFILIICQTCKISVLLPNSLII